uniref:Uncharacterized protein n=1 Tax=viral metagenome TaxID=1070528 RepID=A0A6C0ACZ2_9ZZZZ
MDNKSLYINNIEFSKKKDFDMYRNSALDNKNKIFYHSYRYSVFSDLLLRLIISKKI